MGSKLNSKIPEEDPIELLERCARLSHLRAPAERCGSISEWLVPIVAAVTLLAFVLGTAVLLLTK